MKVAKIINNSVVSIYDEESREIIVMGRDVGFKAKESSTINEEEVKKMFHLGSQDAMDKSKELLMNFPIEHIQTLAEIIGYAKEVLNWPTNPNVYIVLTDHINFALERCKQKVIFPNPLIKEVCSSYHVKYFIGRYTIAIVGRDLRVKLPVDEAIPIVLHVVNAEYDAPMGDTVKITNLIQQALEVVREYFSIELDEQLLSYERFITHLRFLVRWVFTGEHMNLDDLEFQEVIDCLCPEKRACSQKIQTLIKLQYRHQITEEEMAHLALHTKRIRTK